MMTTILLWIALTLSILTLTVVAAPVRLRGYFAYGGKGGEKFGFSVTCLHPWVYRYERGDGESEGKTWVLGRLKKDKGNDVESSGLDDGGSIGDDSGGDADDIDNGDGINDDNTDNIGDTGSGVAINSYGNTNKNSKNNANINDNGDINEDNANNCDINADNADIDANNADIGVDNKKSTRKKNILTRIKSYITALKENNFYKIYADKRLRAKLLKWLRKLPRRVVRSIRLDNLKLHVTAGYRDPASLGKLYGYFIAAKSALIRDNPVADISLRPVFTEERFEVDSEFTVTTSVSMVLWQLTVIAATFPCLRVYKIFKSKKRPKRSR